MFFKKYFHPPKAVPAQDEYQDPTQPSPLRGGEQLKQPVKPGLATFCKLLLSNLSSCSTWQPTYKN
jgi:hypothetical protein